LLPLPDRATEFLHRGRSQDQKKEKAPAIAEAFSKTSTATGHEKRTAVRGLDKNVGE